MAFSAKQVQALRRHPDHRNIRTREANGRELSYLEGWYAISEANRIFGFDAWSRETTESKCVLARENRGSFLAVYTARVRITVQAEGTSVIREGHGTGEGRGTSPGDVHDIALKAAETDATKRALATFGRPFGLELYRKPALSAPKRLPQALPPTPPEGRFGLHPDDATPIPRPSTYHGRHQYLATREMTPWKLAPGNPQQQPTEPVSQGPAIPSIVPDEFEHAPSKIDKSLLTIGEPKRLRDKHHLKFVASQPCLICGRSPCDPHHLRFAQPRAIGMKVSDEFTVPLCRGHHRQLHQAGNELAWWQDLKLAPLEVAAQLWQQTHPKPKTIIAPQSNEDAAGASGES